MALSRGAAISRCRSLFDPGLAAAWPAAAPTVATGPAAARPAGSCRSTTCTLLPPMPMVETAASRVPSSHSAAASGRTRLASPLAISSCGRSAPVAGGTTPVPSASTVLISPAAPAAALAWPMFALTDPSAAGRLAPARSVLKALSSAFIGYECAGPVPFNESEYRRGRRRRARRPAAWPAADCCACDCVSPGMPPPEVPQPRISA